MKLLVTGGAGFIGSHTVDLLLSKGYDVRVLDLLQPRVHPYGKPKYLDPSVEFMQGDVADRSAMEKALNGVEGIFHLAAYQDYMKDFSNFIKTNAYSTALLFELIVEKKLNIKKIVLSSSQSVYGEGKYICKEHGIQHPDSRSVEQLDKADWEMYCPVSGCNKHITPVLIDETFTNPFTAYGISKETLERLAHKLGKRYSIPTVSMRYSIVQGPRNSFFNAYSGVCRIFTLRLINNKPPIIYEDGKQQRDYLHVLDVASANVAVFENKDADYESFNVGGISGVNLIDYTKTLIKVTGKNIEPIISGLYRFGDTRHTVSISEKLKKLGWKNEYTLEDVFRDYLEWVYKQPDLKDRYEEVEKTMKAQNVLRESKSSVTT
ncbi:MAG: NAD-dependent epimerase/dehydratase family protein [Candidatus Melainabacteria bacterium]|nr:NAD-dependent epimerase/dehydratase family protein [Candidatus Melainabacteria bacterium]MBI3308969.1 NAD-dependent epimerase/dehydratase family protein [Candidatus Melainabacteria bacterium]